MTYVFFHRACKAQGVDRRSFSYFGRLQPYCGYAGVVWFTIVTIFYGYPVFKPWGVSKFFQNYTMQLFIPPLFFIWKLIKRTSFVRPHEADLVWERPTVDAYEATFIDPPVGFWTEMGQMIGIRRRKGGNDKREEGIIRNPSNSDDVGEKTV